MATPQVIIQLPYHVPGDYDRLIQIEESLVQAFAQRDPFAEVDGHDVGEGRFNIFVTPRGSWGPVLERVEAYLEFRGVLNDALIVKRLKSERYVVVWPKNYDGTFEV